MSRTIQMFRCGPDMVKIIAPPARESIVPLAITLAERERENKRTSLSRSRRIVNDILHCNHFEFFTTVTIENHNDGSPPTREDVITACKAGIRTFNRYSDDSIGYIVVPELSDSDEAYPGRWHGHIMVTTIPQHMLVPYCMSDKGLPAIIYRRMEAGIECFSVPVFERYGYCLAERIGHSQKDQDTLSKYLTKTMYLETCAPLPRGQRRMMTSHGLERPERIFEGKISDSEYKSICDEADETLCDRSKSVHYLPRSAPSLCTINIPELKISS